MLARRPRQSQYRDPLTGMADPEGFEDARAGFVADSTEKAGAREDARRRLSLLEGVEEPEPQDNRAAAIAELEQLKSELQEAIAAMPARQADFLRQYADEVKAINAKYGIRP
jgi:vacuolar-type H+-ATPase subunit I/STV1